MPPSKVIATSPSPHMSLLNIRRPDVIRVLTRGSEVSILVVARVSAGRSASLYASPHLSTLAIFKSPWATPHACMHRSACPTSCITRVTTPAGAPWRQRLRAEEKRSPEARSKTEHSTRTLRTRSLGSVVCGDVGPCIEAVHRRSPSLAPQVHAEVLTWQSTSASSRPLTRRVWSLGVSDLFSSSGTGRMWNLCQNHKRGVMIIDWALPASEAPTTTSPESAGWSRTLRSTLLRCFTTWRENASRVGSW